MKMVLIPAGDFTMGSNVRFPFEKPPHKVRVTKRFYLGEYHVTVGQFRKFVEQSKFDAGTDEGEELAERLPWSDR